MGIFDNPKRLAKLLSCFKVPGESRPLSPVVVARWLQEGEEELGSAREVMKRIDLKKSMWDGFRNLLSINGDIENSIKWGSSKTDTMQIGFSAARVISMFEPSEQAILINAMWDHEEPFGHDLLRRIRSYYTSHPEESLDNAIKNITKLDRPQKTIISIFISGLDEKIYDKLVDISNGNNIHLDELARQILSEQLPENSVTNVKTRRNFIRIVFSENGKKEFNKLAHSRSISKNDIINDIFERKMILNVA